MGFILKKGFTSNRESNKFHFISWFHANKASHHRLSPNAQPTIRSIAKQCKVKWNDPG